jgi:3-oxoadipate enol-lactonase
VKARVRDIDIYYEIHGAGPRLLFIGGSGGDLRQKPGVFDGPLVRDFEVLSYDQRGLGRSGRPAGPYTMADYGEDAAALLDALDWDCCAVMGVSFGGMVAQELAVRHPSRVSRLVLACTSSGGAGLPSYPLHELQTLSEDERALRGLELSDTRCDAAWRAANPQAAARLLGLAAARASAGADDPGRDAGFRLQLEARAGHDTWDRLPALTMPVYVCGGCHDGIAPPPNQHALARRIPNARLELFEGGHLFLVQDRSAFPRIAEFLRG